MRFFNRLFPSLLFLVFFIPQASAATVGDAFKETFRSSNFIYTNTADVIVKKGGDMDLPFDLSFKVSEKGGKNSGNYGESGEIRGELKNFDDVPKNISDLSTVSFSVQYRDTYLGSDRVTFGELTSARFNTDSKELRKVTEMLNQFLKFMTGKAFRVSQNELAKVLKEELGKSSFISDEELFLSAFSSGKSIDEMVATVGKLLDELIASGVLNDQISAAPLRRAGSRSERDEFHIITLNQSITVQGAELFRKALITFFKEFFPILSSEIEQELGATPAKDFARDINQFLAEVKNIPFKISLTVLDGVLRDLTMEMDLNKVGVPLSLSSNTVFDYSQSFDVHIPQNENAIIDFNKIVEGIVAISKWVPSEISTPIFPFEVMPEKFTISENNIGEIIEHIYAICFDDRGCIRSEVSQIKRDLRDLKHEGLLTHEEYRAILRKIRKEFGM